jgi:hypothetical protein
MKFYTFWISTMLLKLLLDALPIIMVVISLFCFWTHNVADAIYALVWAVLAKPRGRLLDWIRR